MDLRYFLISGFFSLFEKAPAPKDITIKNMKTNESIVIKIPSFPIIFCNYITFIRHFVPRLMRPFIL